MEAQLPFAWHPYRSLGWRENIEEAAFALDHYLPHIGSGTAHQSDALCPSINDPLPYPLRRCSGLSSTSPS